MKLLLDGFYYVKNCKYKRQKIFHYYNVFLNKTSRIDYIGIISKLFYLY